jgi:DNA mismatch repair ATPase MutS
MPTISMFFGILIKMYYREHNPPHFHAYYQGFEAIFDIKSSSKTHGKFPKRAENIVSEWAKDYKKELLEDWNLATEEKPLRKIPGADQ